MKVHHLNCGTMCPMAGRWIEGDGGVFSRGRRVCHCLLVETNAGLVLVETGLGSEDLRQPRRRLGCAFVGLALPRLDPEETALTQIKRLGFAPRDVRHIMLTHGHCDHAGGIGDFPEATVHIMKDEYQGMTAPVGARERNVYRPAQWSHNPRWSLHAADEGDTWNGFSAVQALPGATPEILMLPLPGHTRGHAAVVVQAKGRVLVHAGDAYVHRDQVHSARAEPPLVMRAFHRITDFDTVLRRQNLMRLRVLAREPGVEIFCAHDGVELAWARESTANSVAPRGHGSVVEETLL
jgi:glyoxylase-like metal-dependent hydrolase (beta-lactamase superfamily II)